MNEMSFQYPHFAHLIWLMIGLVIFLLHIRREQERTLQELFAKNKHVSHLIERVSFQKRIQQLIWFALGAIALIAALMRPQRFEEEVTKQLDYKADVMVVLDVSKSMLAEDAAPNRLERAKASIAEMVDQLAGYRVGLIGFAGRSSILCPLTKDYGFFHLSLSAASPLSVSRGGTNIGEALRKALRSFSDGEAARLIVLITDGEDHDSFPLEAAKEAKELGIPIVSIGFGDENGSQITITDPETGSRSVLLDRDGNPVISRLDGELLRNIALETEGIFVPAGVSALDLEEIISKTIRPIFISSSKETKSLQAKEYFAPFLLFSFLSFFLAIWTGVQKERRVLDEK